MVRQERMEHEAAEQELDVEYEVSASASFYWSLGSAPASGQAADRDEEGHDCLTCCP